MWSLLHTAAQYSGSMKYCLMRSAVPAAEEEERKEGRCYREENILQENVCHSSEVNSCSGTHEDLMEIKDISIDEI